MRSIAARRSLQPARSARRPLSGMALMPLEEPPGDDVALITAYRDGDVRGFERLFVRHGERIRALAMRYLRDVAEADDVVQETFLRLLRIADSVDDGFNVWGWLHRVATNICLTRLRTTRRVQVVDSATGPLQGAADLRRTGQPEAAFEMGEAREMFSRVAARLPAQQQARPLLDRQLAEQLADLVAGGDAAGQVAPDGAIVDGAHERHPAQQAAAAQGPARVVEGDGVQPGIQTRVRVEAGQCAEGRQERVLAQVGGQLAVGQEPVQEPQQRTLVVCDELLEVHGRVLEPRGGTLPTSSVGHAGGHLISSRNHASPAILSSSTRQDARAARNVTTPR